MESHIDVFLSYNTKDRGSVEQIAATLQTHGIVVWLDVWNIAPGTSTVSEIDEALKTCRSVAVFISPNNMGRWQQPEIEIAIRQKIHRKIPVMAVLLPGVPDEMINQLPEFLTINRWVDYRDGLESKKGLYDLRWGIKQVQPTDVSPPAAQVVAPADKRRNDDVITRLVEPLKSQNITFFLGSGVYCDEQHKSIRACNIARQLLVELDIIQNTYTNLLPPVDVAGMYYAVNRGEQRLEGKVIELILDNAPNITPTHEHLATLLKLLTERPTRRMNAKSQHLIVTTNIDVMMERALLRAGLPFTRVVQHRSGQQIDVNEYRFVKRVGGEVQLMPMNGQGELVCCAAGNFEEMDAIIESYGRRVFKKMDAMIEPHGRRVLRESGGLTPDYQVEPISSLDLRGMSEPILYKFLGSQDIPNSSVLSTIHHFEFARTILQQNCIPEKITALIGNSLLLFVGLYFMDPNFRLTYFSLLHKTLEVANHLRFALQLPPDKFESDIYRQMEIGMWNSIKVAGMRDQQIETVEESDEVFLQTLMDAVRVKIGSA